MLTIVIGFIGGVLSGLLGVGGGVILVPAMIFLLGLPPAKAIGISLAVVVPTALMGASRHYLLGNFELKVCLFLAVGSVAGAYLGSSLAGMMSAVQLKRMFGVLLLLVGTQMIFGRNNSDKCVLPQPDSEKSQTVTKEP